MTLKPAARSSLCLQRRGREQSLSRGTKEQRRGDEEMDGWLDRWQRFVFKVKNKSTGGIFGAPSKANGLQPDE